MLPARLPVQTCLISVPWASGASPASIGAVSRLAITTRTRCRGRLPSEVRGEKGAVEASAPGTRVEVEGLFYNTPAMKFCALPPPNFPPSQRWCTGSVGPPHSLSFHNGKLVLVSPGAGSLRMYCRVAGTDIGAFWNAISP